MFKGKRNISIYFKNINWDALCKYTFTVMYIYLIFSGNMVDRPADPNDWTTENVCDWLMSCQLGEDNILKAFVGGYNGISCV